MSEAKVYVPKSSAKEVQFKDGGSLIRLSFKADELIAFVQEHVNERGYINLTLSKRREVSQYGETHSLMLDQWKPKPKDEYDQRPPAEQKPAQRPTVSKTKPADPSSGW